MNAFVVVVDVLYSEILSRKIIENKLRKIKTPVVNFLPVTITVIKKLIRLFNEKNKI